MVLDKIHCCGYRELLKKVPENHVHAIITDPPFGIDYQNPYTSKKHSKLPGDDSHFSYEELGKYAYKCLRNNCPIFMFTGWSEYPLHFQELQKSGFNMKEPLICQKRPAGGTASYGSFQPNSDWILFGHKGKFKFKQTKLIKNKKAGIIPNKGRKPVPEYKTRFPSCWFGSQYPYSSENSAFQKKHNIFHPTIKSRKFVEWLILLSTNEGDIIVDPFVGSGTVAVAALGLNRHFIAGDISEEFCQMARNRVENARNNQR